jgi:hypothetical protein
MTSLLFLGMLGVLTAAQAPPRGTELQIFPKHFLLEPGEVIHYQVRIQKGDRSESVGQVGVFQEERGLFLTKLGHDSFLFLKLSDSGDESLRRQHIERG